MVRSEIISKLYQKIHRKLNKADLEKILDIFLNAIIAAIKDDKAFESRKFGRFRPKKIKSRMVRNPKTGTKFFATQKVSIAFKMSKELQKKINEDKVIN
tara:strand:+ start:367 stop:663 length:297 start_codon:yes stop_codon:yes gene_type:complete